MVIRINTKIEWFVASETSHLQKCIRIISRQLLGLLAKYSEFPLSNNSKNSVINCLEKNLENFLNLLKLFRSSVAR